MPVLSEAFSLLFMERACPVWTKCFTCIDSLYTLNNPQWRRGRGITITLTLEMREGKQRGKVSCLSSHDQWSQRLRFKSRHGVSGVHNPNLCTRLPPPIHWLSWNLLGLQGVWALMEQCSPYEHKIKSLRRCQLQVSRAFKLIAQRLKWTFKSSCFPPRVTGSGSTDAISIMTTMLAASAPKLPCLRDWLPPTASPLLHAPLESADSCVHLLKS